MFSDAKKALRNVRISNINRLIFGYLNINSLRNKFDLLCQQIKGSIDIFMISETKLDDSFPQGPFLIDGFHSPFKFDRNKSGGRILLYVREDIPTKIFRLLKAFLSRLFFIKRNGLLIVHIILIRITSNIIWKQSAEH